MVRKGPYERSSTRVAWVAAATLGITLLSVAPASADDRLARTLDRAGAADVAAGVDVDVDGGTVTLGELEVDVPGASEGRRLDAGTEVLSEDGFDTVVREVDDGIQVLSVVHDDEAPDRFDYVFAGRTLEVMDDGSVTVWAGKPTKDKHGESTGAYVATIDAPWAKDAAGNPVPTRYQVRGDRLTQRVQTTEATKYPVVADPRIRACRMGISPSICVRLSKTHSTRMYTWWNRYNFSTAAAASCGIFALVNKAVAAVCAPIMISRAAEIKRVLRYVRGASYRCLEVELTTFWQQYRSVRC